MKSSKGIIYTATALLTGHAAFYLMMQTVNGGPWSWWGPIMLGASILLMAGGIRAFLPQLATGWLAAFAAAVPLAICSLFGTLPLRCWIYAATLALTEWVILRIDIAVRRGDVAGFSASLLLAISWVFVSVNTIRVFLSPNYPGPGLAPLALLLFYWLLIIASLARSGIGVLRGLP